MSALALVERERLSHLVQVVDGALDYFATAGKALAEIRDSGLYRETHDTFEKFCASQWGMTDRRAYQLIDAADVVRTIVHTGAPLPANEGQARALAAAAPDDRADVMATVAARGKPTAAAIADEIRGRRPEPAPPEPEHDVCTSCGAIDPPGIAGGTCQDCWEASQPEPPRPPQPKRRPETLDERAAREAQQRREDTTADVARALADLQCTLMVPNGAIDVVTGWQPEHARHHVLLLPGLLTADGIRGVARMLDGLADLWIDMEVPA